MTTNTSTTPALCGECGRPHYRKRERMPLDHAVQTIEGILISRLDDLFAEWVDGDGEKFGLTCSEWIELFQSIQLKLFPHAFDDGDDYETDPAGRMDIPPRKDGLVLKRPTAAILAHHLIQQERATAAGRMQMPNGNTVFTDEDLLVLRGRRGRRENRVALVK